jgi:hypothetical protein
MFLDDCSDPDGDPVTLDSAQVTSGPGSARSEYSTVVGNNILEFDADSNDLSTATVEYTVSDDRGGTFTGTVTLEPECFPDDDGDGYGDSSASGTARSSCNSGEVANDDDCYDSNDKVKPGQTKFFSTDRGDGSFDYNCDGTEEKFTHENRGTQCLCKQGGWADIRMCSSKIGGEEAYCDNVDYCDSTWTSCIDMASETGSDIPVACGNTVQNSDTPYELCPPGSDCDDYWVCYTGRSVLQPDTMQRD